VKNLHATSAVALHWAIKEGARRQLPKACRKPVPTTRSLNSAPPVGFSKVTMGRPEHRGDRVLGEYPADVLDGQRQQGGSAPPTVGVNVRLRTPRAMPPAMTPYTAGAVHSPPEDRGRPS
jgi:hypothetical protein